MDTCKLDQKCDTLKKRHMENRILGVTKETCSEEEIVRHVFPLSVFRHSQVFLEASREFKKCSFLFIYEKHYCILIIVK